MPLWQLEREGKQDTAETNQDNHKEVHLKHDRQEIKGKPLNTEAKKPQCNTQETLERQDWKQPKSDHN